MEIAVTQEQGSRPVTVFTITGTIDSATSAQLQEQAQQAHQSGTRDLIVDLKGVDYVSSAGIRALNAILKMLRTDAPGESEEAMSKGLRDGTWKSPHLKLVNANRFVMETFKVAGMDMIFEIFDDLKKAIASF
jgi:stage II sporulation protein AA (anti-sigma F factor antagonist)